MTGKTNTTDLHDLTLQTLPEWGPGVPGTPVEVTYSDGAVVLFYAWRDGSADTTDSARKCRQSPVPWMGGRITAVLSDNPAHWVPVDADERRELGDHLAGARVCCERGGVTIVGPVVEVDEDGWLWAKAAYLLAAPYSPLRVHPADLAAAREACRLSEEEPIGSVAPDGNGRSWQRDAAGWRCADGGPRTWVVLNDRSGPATVIHRAEES